MTEIDLTPSDSPAPSPKGRSYRNIAIVGSIVVVVGFILVQALTSARVFFLNVDEAVAQQSDLDDTTFRMQGVVVNEPANNESGALTFEMSFNDVEAEVVHVGEEPTDLFEVGQNVVVEGHWSGETFTSRQILVKHSESYVAENPDRPGMDQGIE